MSRLSNHFKYFFNGHCRDNRVVCLCLYFNSELIPKVVSRESLIKSLIMSHVKEMSNVLIDSVLLGNLRMFAFEEEKPKVVVHEPEVDQFDPPEPITSQKLKEINNKLGMIYSCFPDGE